jgi:hypothetical protein
MKKFLLRFLPRLFAALLAAWILTLGGLSWVYLDSLTAFPCPPSAQSRPGYEAVLINSAGHNLSGWWRWFTFYVWESSPAGSARLTICRALARARCCSSTAKTKWVGRAAGSSLPRQRSQKRYGLFPV